jgi:hypothetical protein
MRGATGDFRPRGSALGARGPSYVKCCFFHEIFLFLD